ncbi:UBP1-associated protein 2C [Tripterygium wilfordii]|uniref:UBP1-associated protein 2C n=1 Tax=Tripterygium wilfordii TaxID=458696 RepID=A0A7J7C9W0_TRIWF|nr:UBP1-associated protein 2C-like [Tripterygium wilfordii]XP_038685530.1 UBP1-associated protein 2C-like [Tripterygium wilfordii]XP_038685531.1 UBP1-associated protein 2C-like [Tripterygium wilfordii]KAF5730715.1 UBP1-associated protein 2C [Tripterygium wilfordii]
MDLTKKRKLEENGLVPFSDPDSATHLTLDEGRKLIERFTYDQLLSILQQAVVRHPVVLDAVRSIADPDSSQRKLFIRGLGWETTNDSLRSLFSAYGELEEAVVILDKQTGKSKGYGFVTFKHVDGAVLALREPSKKIDGRVTVTQLAAAGNSGNNSSAADISMRKIYVANVPFDMPSDKLLALFASFGEIEEGPLGFDKQTGKSRGFALFVYKTPEGAQAALVEPTKNIDGRQLICKLAIDGKKGKSGPGQVGTDAGQNSSGNLHGDGMGMVPPGGSMHGSYGGAGGAGGPGGMGPYGGFSGGPPLGHHHMNQSMGGPGLPSQATSNLGAGTSGYGAGGLGGPYGGYGGTGSSGYSGLGGAGVGAGAGSGLGGVSAAGSSLYRLPPSSVGISSGGYPESAHYSLSSTSAFPSQHLPATGTSPAPRVPSGGMYPNVPSYY